MHSICIPSSPPPLLSSLLLSERGTVPILHDGHITAMATRPLTALLRCVKSSQGTSDMCRLP